MFVSVAHGTEHQCPVEAGRVMAVTLPMDVGSLDNHAARKSSLRNNGVRVRQLSFALTHKRDPQLQVKS